MTELEIAKSLCEENRTEAEYQKSLVKKEREDNAKLVRAYDKMKAENARLKEQVGRLSGVSKEVRRLWGTGDLCPYRGVDNDGDWSTVARAMDSFNAALSGTDGEAWLNEEQMKGAVGWKPIGTAPKDRWIDGLYEEGPETIRWSDDRACMLGRRAGAYPPGWEDEENHLPVDSPIAWREAKALRSKGGERAT